MAMRIYSRSGHWLAVASGITRVACGKSELAFTYAKRASFQLRPITGSSMTSPLIDVDCNLWHEDLRTLQNKESCEDGNDWNILHEDAIQQANIVAVLSPSSTLQEARAGLDRLSRTPPPLPIKTTVGVHPYHVNDDEFQGQSLEEHGQAMRDLLKANASLCAAVGECGLDTSEGFPPIQDQLPWFQLQVQIAQELNLPLFVHERFAFDETLKILEDITVPIIIHCFTGTKEECIEYVKRGYYISVSGFILKDSENSAAVCSCLEEGVIPLDKLMIETDSPYMGFSNCRQLYVDHNEEFVNSLNSKKRKRLIQSIYPNVPSSLPQVLEKVVQCLQQYDTSLSREDIAQSTTKNANSFFGFGI
jgi:TatD DNase family protein